MQTLQYDMCNSSDAYLSNKQNPSKPITTKLFSTCSSSFSDKIISNVCKSITMYANKSEQVLNTLNNNQELTTQQSNNNSTEYSFITLQPSQLQMKNLEFVNLTHHLYEQLTLIFDSYKLLNPKLTAKLENSLKTLLAFEENALSPFISSVSAYILAIMLTMHQEDFHQASNNPQQVRSQVFLLIFKNLTKWQEFF